MSTGSSGSGGVRPAKKPGDSPSFTLQTAERALRFLEIVASSPAPLNVRQVAERLEINLTTGYHLANTLMGKGYIERAGDGTLRVGFQVAVLYDGYLRSSTSAQMTTEIVKELAQQTQESAWISILRGDSVVLTAFAEGAQAVRATGLHVGLSGREHVRSSGRVVLAYLPDSRRTRVLDSALKDVSASDRRAIEASLEDDLAEIRSRGYAVDDELFQEGILGVGAPFFAADGVTVVGSVGIWAPAARGRADLPRMTERVCEAARKASATIGRSGASA